MRIRVSIRLFNLLALKLVPGTTAAAAVLLNGVKFGGCPPGTLCLFVSEFYSMRLDPWSGLMTLFAFCLLLSAFTDLLSGTGQFELLERDVESIADTDQGVGY